jgi:hypothetical protein
MIIYLNDVEECGGATAVVPRVGINDPAYEYPMTSMPGFGALQWRNNRQKAEGYTSNFIPFFSLFMLPIFDCHAF